MSKNVEMERIFKEFIGNDVIERVDSFKLCLISLINAYVSIAKFDKSVQQGSMIRSHEQRKVVSLMLKFLCSRPRLSAYQLWTVLKAALPAIIFEKMCSDLLSMTEDFNAFLSLIDDLRTIFDAEDRDERILIQSNSFTGHFVRKVRLTLKKSSLTELTLHWNRLKSYIKHLRCMNHDKFSTINRVGTSEQMVETDEREKETYVLADKSASSMQDFEAFLDEQINLLHKTPSKAASYFYIEERLLSEASSIPYSTDIHYLKYLNALRFGDFDGAEHALHEYFDWKFLDSYKNRSSAANRVTPGEQSLRYGPLLLAKLNRSFGFKEQAVAHLKECITKSLEATDVSCLQHAMVEYCSVLREIDPASFVHVFHSVNSDISNDASFKVKLCKILFDYEFGRSFQSLEFLYGQSLEVDDIEIGARISRNFESVCLATLSSLYLAHGCVEQATLESKKLLASSNAVANSMIGTISIDSESLCIAACNLAICRHLKGEIASSSDLLHKAKIDYDGSRFQNHVLLTEGLIMFDRSLLNADFDSCKNWISQVSAVSEEEGQLCSATLCLTTGRYEGIAIKLKALLRAATNCYFRCRIALRLAGCFLVAENNFGAALQYITDCLSWCADSEYRLIRALALRLKAFILFEMREVDLALHCLDDAEDLLMATGHLVELGKLSLLKIRMFRNMNILMGRSIADECLVNAISFFRKCSASYLEKEAAFSLALHYGEVKLIQERNHWANKFKEMDENLPGSYPVLILL